MQLGRLLIIVVAAAMLFACVQTRQAGEPVKSGFLGDYSRLQEGEEGEAALVYRNPAADRASYDKIMLDPISFWRDPGAEDDGISPEDRQNVVNNFYKMLHDRLSKDYEMVTEPGPNTLRMQVAITRADQSNPVPDTISSIIPQMVVVGSATEYVTGKTMFGGQASVEAKVTDAQTGEILFEGVDRRKGAKNIIGATDSWRDVNESMEYWADQVAYRLCQWRGDKDCVEPEA
jgi:Protein of unknown function (DUF3313)